MSIPKFSVKNSFLVNMLMIFTFIMGFIALMNLPREANPQIDFDMVVIISAYPGVSPEEMEKLVTDPIEEKVKNLDDIDYFTSTSGEGISRIFIQYEAGLADFDKAVSDLKSEVNAVDLPDDVDDPMVYKITTKNRQHVLSISLGGEFDDNILREIAENLKEKLTSVDHVSEIDLFGTRERQIHIKLNPDKMTNFNISVNEIISAISYRNMNIPGGVMKFGRNDFLLRTIGEFETVADMQNLVIRSNSQGNLIRLQDIATIKDTLEDVAIITKVNGTKAVNLYIRKEKEGNIIDIVNEVKRQTEEFQQGIPGLDVEYRNDFSKYVKESVNQLSSNALFGLVLVAILLILFLGWRSALFAVLGIPFTFLLTFFIMDAMGETLNTLSLFALLLVIGMIVDDAIVILENVHRYMEMGYGKVEAAIKGSEEVMWPVTAAVLTTIAAFLPMLMMEGVMGKFMAVFPVIVSIALAASLVEAVIVLPSHLADFGKVDPNQKTRFQTFFTKTQEKYRRAIKIALKHRYISVLIIIILFSIAGSMMGMGLVKMEFFPQEESDTIVLQLQTPIGTKIQETESIVKRIEDHLLSGEIDDIDAVITNVGMMTKNHRWEVYSHNAQMYIDLIDEEERKFNNEETKGHIREYVEAIPGIMSINFTQQQGGPPTGTPIELRIKGDNLGKLKNLSDYAINIISGIPGTTDLQDSFEQGKKEVKIIPFHDKIAMYNLSVSQISSAVRTAFDGITVSKYRGKSNKEYDIILTYADEYQQDMEDLRNLTIMTPAGATVRISDIAEIKIEQGLNAITHRDTKRYINVTGNVDSGYNVDEVNLVIQEKLADFSAKFPGYFIEYGGRMEEQNKSYASLYRAFILAVLLIYMILGTQFKSWVQPLIVMLTVPFAFIGVIFGLVISNLPFSITTMISIVALAGVVVNDSLVLVDFVNRLRSQGVGKWHSLIEAGATRLRPIILTTITTIGGLLPMSLNMGGSSDEWRPMAVSISWGLAFATLLTLFVIPCFYAILDEWFGKLKMTRFDTHEKFVDEYKENGIEKLN